MADCDCPRGVKQIDKFLGRSAKFKPLSHDFDSKSLGWFRELESLTWKVIGTPLEKTFAKTTSYLSPETECVVCMRTSVEESMKIERGDGRILIDGRHLRYFLLNDHGSDEGEGRKVREAIRNETQNLFFEGGFGLGERHAFSIDVHVIIN